MASQQTTIDHISDTARWVAVYRAEESERPDAHFHDPFARRLAGEQGERIVTALSRRSRVSWPIVARTWLVDRMIKRQVEQGAGIVVNLAAGLDSRPYRMDLPSSLTWVEVDLPGILDYKEEMLRNEKPKCKLERIRLDLSDSEGRQKLFRDLRGRAGKRLVITEGLVIYLKEQQVSDLARDLAADGGFQNWILEMYSPRLIQMMKKQMEGHFREGAADFQFAPKDSIRFFADHGWNLVEMHSLLRTAAQLKRLTWFFRLFAMMPDRAGPQSVRPWSGACLLRNGTVTT